jgi:hypothetical protein
MQSSAAHKDETNAELINKLDRDFNLLKCYPQSEDPTMLEFWSERDPSRKPGFQSLMYMHRKVFRITLQGDNGYFIEIDNKEKDHLW